MLHQRWIWRSHRWETFKKGSTLALKPRTDVTRSPKQGYQWSHEKDLCPPTNFFYLCTCGPTKSIALVWRLLVKISHWWRKHGGCVKWLYVYYLTSELVVVAVIRMSFLEMGWNDWHEKRPLTYWFQGNVKSIIFNSIYFTAVCSHKLQRQYPERSKYIDCLSTPMLVYCPFQLCVPIWLHWTAQWINFVGKNGNLLKFFLLRHKL